MRLVVALPADEGPAGGGEDGGAATPGVSGGRAARRAMPRVMAGVTTDLCVGGGASLTVAAALAESAQTLARVIRLSSSRVLRLSTFLRPLYTSYRCSQQADVLAPSINSRALQSGSMVRSTRRRPLSAKSAQPAQQPRTTRGSLGASPNGCPPPCGTGCGGTAP